MGLTKLLASERSSLHNLMVRGELIVKPEMKHGEYITPCCISSIILTDSLVIMTRSKTKTSKGHPFRDHWCQIPYLAITAPHEFTSIPFPTKALKIIIHDLQSGGDSATITAQGNTFTFESDDGVSVH